MAKLASGPGRPRHPAPAPDNRHRPLARRLADLTAHPLSEETTHQTVHALRDHGTDPDGPLATLAAQAVGVLEDPSTVTGSLIALTEDLLTAYDSLAQ